MLRQADRHRVLVFIVAFNAEHTIQHVLRRIPASLKAHDTHILVIDDSSRDHTFTRAAEPAAVDRFVQHDLDHPRMPVDPGDFDDVLLLDVIEHLSSPEAFVEQLRRSRTGPREPVVIVSTGNVAFVVVRLMLFFGCFNYGPRGILDLSHRRLFTFSTLRALFRQAGFQIDETRGLPFRSRSCSATTG